MLLIISQTGNFSLGLFASEAVAGIDDQMLECLLGTAALFSLDMAVLFCIEAFFSIGQSLPPLCLPSSPRHAVGNEHESACD